MKAFETSGGRGMHPYTVLGLLDPDSQIPVIPQPTELRTPFSDRFVFFPIDLDSPLEHQFDAAAGQAQAMQAVWRLLRDEPARRRRTDELQRTVLICALRWSRRLKIREIAAEVFPLEKPPSAERKVKTLLRQAKATIQERLEMLPDEGAK